jgi:hypothetical protein
MNRTARLAAASTAAALLLPGAAVANGAAAGAAGAAQSRCAPDSDTYKATVKKDFDLRATHGRLVVVPADKSRTVKGPLPEIATLRPAVTKVGEGSGARVLTAAEKAIERTKGFDVDLAGLGARTPGGPDDDGSIDTFWPTGERRFIAVFHGYRMWKGTWTRTLCGTDGRVALKSSGTWASFAPGRYSGSVECDAAAVKAASAKPSSAWKSGVCATVRAAGS